MNLSLTIRFKWWFRFAMAGAVVYEMWRWITFRPVTDAEVERLAEWITKHAVIVDVDG